MLTELWLAIQFLTRLPTPSTTAFSPELLARSARCFPLVGLLVGGIVLLCLWPAQHHDVWLQAWLGVLAWIVVTGGLHLDGLADVADALGAAHRDRSRLLAVMKDPHLGSFGVLTLIVAVSGKLVLLMLVAKQQAWWALGLIPAWARLGVLSWQTLPPLTASGLAEAFTWQQPRYAPWLWLLLLTSVSAYYVPVLCLMPIVILLYRRWLQQTLGGMSGDCLGAGVEVTELVGLLLVGIAS